MNVHYAYFPAFTFAVVWIVHINLHSLLLGLK